VKFHRKNLSLLLAVVIVALGLACNSPSAPTPDSMPNAPGVPRPSPIEPVFEMVDVRVEGRVVDADRGTAIPHAVVTLVGFCARGTTEAGGACRNVVPPAPSVTADANGVFALMANIPQTWDGLLLGVSRDGYEAMRNWVRPSDVTAATLRVFPTLMISPGESFTTHTFLGGTVCGDEGYYCRRVIIKASPGELIDVEVIPVEGQTVGILEGSVTLSFPSQRQLTVSGSREVWIYAGSATGTPFYHVFEQRVTVTARRH
jgi:hypothetical protein